MKKSKPKIRQTNRSLSKVNVVVLEMLEGENFDFDKWEKMSILFFEFCKQFKNYWLVFMFIFSLWNQIDWIS
jgi:hypothetical protein